VSKAIVRDAIEADMGTIVDLNRSEQRQTSPMDIARLVQLHSLASYHKVAMLDGQVVAFLLGISNGAAYDSDNYRYFASRYERFLYVDRIVVGAGTSRSGVGTALYEDLFASARALGLPFITCEYNIEPPNAASRSFHQKFGFREVGRQRVANGTKLVSLQVAGT